MYTLVEIIRMAATIATVLVVVRAFWSWVSPYPTNAAMRLVWNLTEPILAPVRSILPSMGGLDLSPMVAVVLIQLLEMLLVRLALG